MKNIDVWKMIEDIVEDNNPPYCFEEAELKEILDSRNEKIVETREQIAKTVMLMGIHK